MLVGVVCCVASVWAQTDRAVITHNSESITIAPIVYGIEKGFYRNEGINWNFVFCVPILPRLQSPAGKR